MTKTQEQKQILRNFMRDYYTDEKLAEVLAHAQDGKLSYNSCCCFIGAVTADHALRSELPHSPVPTGSTQLKHYRVAKLLHGARLAESAFLAIGGVDNIWLGADKKRRRILIPMLRAEMRRRERLQAQVQKEPENAVLNYR